MLAIKMFEVQLVTSDFFPGILDGPIMASNAWRALHKELKLKIASTEPILRYVSNRFECKLYLTYMFRLSIVDQTSGLVSMLLLFCWLGGTMASLILT
jgi:hypothetical protein